FGSATSDVLALVCQALATSAPYGAVIRTALNQEYAQIFIIGIQEAHTAI
ncbi:6793_t:CDS:1, partial [Acaulospora colombiana]